MIHFFIFVVYVGEIIFEPFSCECGVLGGETWQYLVLTMNESYKLWQSFSLFDQRMLILPSLLWYFLWWKLLQFIVYLFCQIFKWFPILIVVQTHLVIDIISTPSFLMFYICVMFWFSSSTIFCHTVYILISHNWVIIREEWQYWDFQN